MAILGIHVSFRMFELIFVEVQVDHTKVPRLRLNPKEPMDFKDLCHQQLSKGPFRPG